MTLTINGEPREVAPDQPGTNKVKLPDLLRELGFSEIPVLVEHNGIALRPREHNACELRPGDRLEIIRVVAGG